MSEADHLRGWVSVPADITFLTIEAMKYALLALHPSDVAGRRRARSAAHVVEGVLASWSTGAGGEVDVVPAVVDNLGMHTSTLPTASTMSLKLLKSSTRKWSM